MKVVKSNYFIWPAQPQSKIKYKDNIIISSSCLLDQRIFFWVKWENNSLLCYPSHHTTYPGWIRYYVLVYCSEGHKYIWQLNVCSSNAIPFHWTWPTLPTVSILTHSALHWQFPVKERHSEQTQSCHFIQRRWQISRRQD
jgi:hypothetical protein